MSEPITVDIPHKLGREVARARIDGGIGKLADMVPGGGTVEHAWAGDVMTFTLAVMGQKVVSRLEVFDDKIHAVVSVPPMLALFAGKIRDKVVGSTTKLLK